MDTFLGQILEKIDKKDVLMVISDHGFKQFKWGVNLNTWLWENGYLVFNDNSSPSADSWFAGVNWKKTKAYAYGLAGIFLNTAGREAQGIVEPGKKRNNLLLELKEMLESITDQNNGIKPITTVHITEEILSGPYVNEAPDLLIGYKPGYRASWNSAVGRITDAVIEENTKSWSGDHSIDPRYVPGVFFCNWHLKEKKSIAGRSGSHNS